MRAFSFEIVLAELAHKVVRKSDPLPGQGIGIVTKSYFGDQFGKIVHGCCTSC